MQIIESTDMAGTRSAVHTLGRTSTPLRFVVFPMVHLAEASFYEQVTARLGGCDLVVAEGVTGDSVRMRALTASYRWLAGGRFGLEAQAIDLDGIGVPVVNPDISARELGREWRRGVPRLTSAAVWFLVPVYTAGLRLFGTRRFIGRNLAMDDLPSPSMELQPEWADDMLDVIVRQRDDPLVDTLASIHEERREEPIRVGVAYGARHVPAVVAALHELGYRSRHAEWLTVFASDR